MEQSFVWLEKSYQVVLKEVLSKKVPDMILFVARAKDIGNQSQLQEDLRGVADVINTCQQIHQFSPVVLGVLSQVLQTKQNIKI